MSIHFWLELKVSERIGRVIIVIAGGHLLQPLLYLSHIICSVAPALKQSQSRPGPHSPCTLKHSSDLCAAVNETCQGPK